MTSNEPAALYEVRGQVGIVTLNRPHAMNAVNGALAAAVGEALSSADDDPGVAAMVLTGAGRAFCAGMDLKAYAAGEPIDAPGHPEWGFAGFVRHALKKPVIAAVNGFAMGGGTELVLAADLAIAARSAVLGLPEVKRGLVAAGGGVLRLPRQIPRKLAMEIVLTGQPVPAERAALLGMINGVVEDDELLDAAIDLAGTIAENAPLAVQASKRMMTESLVYADESSDEAWTFQDRVIAPVFSSEDAQEGARAFAEKRPARWTGR